MNVKKLLVVAIAGAFSLPLAAQVSAAGDTMILAQGPSGASSVGTGPTGGTPSPQSAGEPKAPMAGERGTAAGGTAASSMDRAPDFSAIDKNGDGQISRAEWDAHYRSGSAAGGATTAPSGAVVSPASPGKTGTTAGPGEASPRPAPSSDTATSPSTSGTGKAQ
jgi:hypothetical protein